MNVIRDSPVRLLVCAVPPFSPVSEPRLEWKVGLFIFDPDAAPCRRTRETSADTEVTAHWSHSDLNIFTCRQTGRNIHETNEYFTTKGR